MTICFFEAVGPICLPYRFRNDNSMLDNRAVSVAGWGTTEFGGPVSSVLKMVTLNTISNSLCSFKMKNIDNNKICTFTTRRDTCQYDSGANLCHFASRWYSVGLTSFGIGCATDNPSVSTRVTSYISWIEQRSGVRFCNK